MGKGKGTSAARREKRHGKSDATRQLSPLVGIHPMFKTKLGEITLEQAAAQKKADSVPAWDELNKMYVLAWKAISTPMILGALAKRKDIIAMIPDHSEVISRKGMLERDINLLRSELSAIADKHKDKVGSEDDPDLIMTAAMIGEEYQAFIVKAEATIGPNMEAILAIFADAELRLKAQQEALGDMKQVETKVVEVTDVEARAAEQDARIIEQERQQQVG